MPTDPMTSAQVAEIFGVRTETVTRWAESGRLRHFKTPNGRYRFRRADVEALLAAVTVEAVERVS